MLQKKAFYILREYRPNKLFDINGLSLKSGTVTATVIILFLPGLHL